MKEKRKSGGNLQDLPTPPLPRKEEIKGEDKRSLEEKKKEKKKKLWQRTKKKNKIEACRLTGFLIECLLFDTQNKWILCMYFSAC